MAQSIPRLLWCHAEQGQIQCSCVAAGSSSVPAGLWPASEPKQNRAGGCLAFQLCLLHGREVLHCSGKQSSVPVHSGEQCLSGALCSCSCEPAHKWKQMASSQRLVGTSLCSFAQSSARAEPRSLPGELCCFPEQPQAGSLRYHRAIRALPAFW